MPVYRKKEQKKNLNILFYFILLYLLPLFLQNYTQFKFLSQGTHFYTLYCNSLHILLCLYFTIFQLKQFRIPRWLLFFIIIFGLDQVLSFSNSHKLFNDGLFELINTITSILGILTVGGIVYQRNVDKVDITNFIKKIIYLVLVSCIYNILINYDIVYPGYSIKNSSGNFASFFSNRNTFASLIVIGVISCIYYINFTCKHKILYYTYLAIFLLNLIWTQSMNSYVSVCVFIIIFLWMNSKQKIIKKIKVLFFITIAGIIVLSTGLFEGIINFISYGDVTELSGRLEVWSTSIQYIVRYPLLGIGLGHSKTILMENGISLDQFHNAYIEILVSSGLVGMLLYLIVIFKVFKDLLYIYRVNVLKGSILIASFLSFLFWGMFESWMLFRNGYFSFIITIFYIVIPLIEKRKIDIERNKNFES